MDAEPGPSINSYSVSSEQSDIEDHESTDFNNGYSIQSGPEDSISNGTVLISSESSDDSLGELPEGNIRCKRNKYGCHYYNIDMWLVKKHEDWLCKDDFFNSADICNRRPRSCGKTTFDIYNRTVYSKKCSYSNDQAEVNFTIDKSDEVVLYFNAYKTGFRLDSKFRENYFELRMLTKQIEHGNSLFECFLCLRFTGMPGIRTFLERNVNNCNVSETPFLPLFKQVARYEYFDWYWKKDLRNLVLLPGSYYYVNIKIKQKT